MRLLERLLEGVKPLKSEVREAAALYFEPVQKLLRPRTFSGTVLDVNFVSGEGRHNFHKQSVTLHHGYDGEGMPIKESYVEGGYDVTLRNPDGAQKTFRVFGKPPEVGTEQKYRI